MSLPSRYSRNILSTAPDAVACVRQYTLDTPDILVTGGGWDHTSWLSWPSAVSSTTPKSEHQPDAHQADLDADDVVQGPIILQSKDCHALWVSPAMLKLSMPFPESVDGGVMDQVTLLVSDFLVTTSSTQVVISRCAGG